MTHTVVAVQKTEQRGNSPQRTDRHRFLWPARQPWRQILCPRLLTDFPVVGPALIPEIRHIVSLCRDPCTRNPACGTRGHPLPSETLDRHPLCGHVTHRRHTELPTIPQILIPLAANHRPSRHCSNPTNKNGVFHVKHAVRFPTAATIKPSSSPIRGTFRSRADSAQVRPQALPAQTRPSPAHNRSRRSATRPVRSARSAALQRPYRATH